MLRHRRQHTGAGTEIGGWWFRMPGVAPLFEPSTSLGDGGGQGGFRTMTQEEMGDLFGDAHPFSDFFTMSYALSCRRPHPG